MVAGRKPKPALQVVREGNPGKRPVRDAVTLPPSALSEPDWHVPFAGNKRAMKRARATAHQLWTKLAPTLSRSAGLVGEQQEVLVDYIVTWCRIEQGEHALALDGVLVETERGWVKNPWTTVLNQYRSNLRSLIGELGLSPSAATRLSPPAGDDDGDIFD